MRSGLKTKNTILLTSLFSAIALAGEPTKNPEITVEDFYGTESGIQLRGASFYFENDVVFEEDDGYTNGVQADLEFTWDAYHDALERGINADRSKIIWSLGQTMYTPSNKDSLDPADYDLPYAGVLYSTLASVYGWEGDDGRIKVTGRTGLNLLVVGPNSGAEQVQDQVHTSDLAGWENQIGQQFGLGLSQHFYFKMLETPNQKIALTPYVGGEAGNLRTYGEAGVRLDVALLGKLIDDLDGPVGISPSATASIDEPLNVSIFVDANGKAYVNNYPIDGDSYFTADDPNGMDLKTGVGKISTGVEVNFTTKRGRRVSAVVFGAVETPKTDLQDSSTFAGAMLSIQGSPNSVSFDSAKNPSTKETGPVRKVLRRLNPFKD